MRVLIKNLFYFLAIGILFPLFAGCAPRPIIFVPQEPPPLPAGPPPRVAVVLGGGGARGFAHIGVLKVLQQYRVPVDMVVGTSSGSIVGAIYADNPNTDALQRTLIHAQRSDLVDISALHALEGPITGNALQNFILTHVRARTFNQLPLRFVVVATDLRTGATVPLASGPIAPAVNASAALPPFFRPVNLYGHTLIDGGTTDPVAVDVARAYKPKVVIAVSIVPDLPPYAPSYIIGVYDRAYYISDLKFNEYSMQTADVKIHPVVGQTGVFDDSNKRALVRAGEKAALKAIPEICAELQRYDIPSACSHGPQPVAEKTGAKILKFITSPFEKSQ